MDEGNDLEGLGIYHFFYLKLKPNESIDQPARELKPRTRIAVDEKFGGCGAFRVKIRCGRYNVDGFPGGFNRLPIEGKLVYVVP